MKEEGEGRRKGDDERKQRTGLKRKWRKREGKGGRR